MSMQSTKQIETDQVTIPLLVFSYIKLSSPKLNNVMVIGAIHIQMGILLFVLDEWFLRRGILGHVCTVGSSLSASDESVSNVLVANLSLHRWLLAYIRLDVPQNAARTSNLHLARSTTASIQSSQPKEDHPALTTLVFFL